MYIYTKVACKQVIPNCVWNFPKEVLCKCFARTYKISKAVQNYLVEGCSWRILGLSEIIQNILNEANENMIIYSLNLN